MKIFFLFLSLLSIPFFGFTQSFNWGSPVPITDETEAIIKTNTSNDSFYTYYAKYEIGLFNFDVYAEHFDLSTLDNNRSQSMSVGQPNSGISFRKHIDGFKIDNTNFALFSQETDRKTKENQLFLQIANLENSNKEEPVKITSIQGKSINKAGTWRINQSENGKFYVILKELPYTKKVNEKIALVLLDKDFNIISEKSHTLTVIDKRNKQNFPYVSNSGKVFFVKNIKLKKQKPFKNIYSWDHSKDEIKEFSTKQDDNFQIYQYDIDFDSEDNMYFNGLLSKKGSSNFSVSVGRTGKDSKGIVAIKIDKNGELVYNKRNDFEKTILNVNLKDFYLYNNQIWLLADKMTVSTKKTHPKDPKDDIIYSYSYSNYGFVLGGIQTDNGNLAWVNILKTHESSTMNDNGTYLSFAYFFNNDKLSILYNESRNLNIKKFKLPFYRRFPILDTYNSNGDLVSHKEVLDAGIGVKREELFELDPAVFHKIEDNKYVIRARSREEYKYGYIIFE